MQPRAGHSCTSVVSTGRRTGQVNQETLSFSAPPPPCFSSKGQNTASASCRVAVLLLSAGGGSSMAGDAGGLRLISLSHRMPYRNVAQDIVDIRGAMAPNI